MNRLETNQMKFINLRLGTFIHFNSATIQFQNSEIFDWEYDHENNGEKMCIRDSFSRRHAKKIPSFV